MKNLYIAVLLLTATSGYAQNLETVTVDGKSRTMMVYTPSGLTDNCPLVISLHGAGQDAAYQRDQTKWNNCADTAKFVVAYPNAINKFWDTSGQSDIKFISWIIDEMHSRYNINLDRVYITGFSLGAMMTYHCAEHLGDRVAAFGPVSGVRFDNRAPQAPRRVAIIHTHGTGDNVFYWNGDPGHAAGGYPSIPEYVESWATYENLTEKEVISPYPSSKTNSIATMTVWRSSEPDDDIEVALLALKDKGHWHSEDLASGVSTTQEIWKFCKRYSLQPEPPKVASIIPEDSSFDLTPDVNSFTLTLSDATDISAINATIADEKHSISLTFPETENATVLNFELPETESLVEGKYTLTVAGIRNPKGGKEKNLSFTYYYGPSEYGDQIKEAFQQVYDYAIELYEKSEDATTMSVINARNRLKKYIDKYAGFQSTAPSEYAKATENLMKNFEIIEAYIESSGVGTTGEDAEVVGISYFNLDGCQTDKPDTGISIAVKKLSDGTTRIEKILQ